MCTLCCLCYIGGMSTNEAYALPLTLGQQMANARKRAGLTQAQLGRRWNEHRNTIGRWEKDGGEPSFSQMVDLSSISGWPLDLFARAAVTAPGGPDVPPGQEIDASGWFAVTEGEAVKLDRRPLADVLPFTRSTTTDVLALASGQ